MNKIRTISTRIDSFIKNADLTYSPTLQQIYNDYAEGINYLNERLAICEGLLQKGKYGEVRDHFLKLAFSSNIKALSTMSFLKGMTFPAFSR